MNACLFVHELYISWVNIFRFRLKNHQCALQKPGKNRKTPGPSPKSRRNWWTSTSAIKLKYLITFRTTSKTSFYNVSGTKNPFLESYFHKCIAHMVVCYRIAIVPVTLLLRNCTKTSLDILVDTSKSPDR